MSMAENIDGIPLPPTDGTVELPGKPGQYAATLGVESNSQSLIHDRTFGDYELISEIARGAMGVVYRARQVSLNRVVAIKMILAGRFASTIDIQRFRQEAEAAATLDHANILPIYEVGEHDGHQYFAMKLAEGGSLAEKMAELRKDPRQAVRVLEQIARGVHHAHQRGILHRDLKPANILLQNDVFGKMNDESKAGHSSFITPHSSLIPLVTDFGLAKKTEKDSGITQSGAIVGTPSYMAPEQARGSKIITTSADIYSLGAMLYEILTAVPPFRGDSVAQTLRMVEEQEPLPPRNLNPETDADLEAVALKCLEKDPARRYETAGAFADDLSAWLRGEPVTARRAGWSRRGRKWVRRNPSIAVLTAIIVLILIAGSTVSAMLAVRAEKRAKEAAKSEREALAHEATARDREEVLQDTLCVTTFERARAERMAARPGWRARSLALLQEATRMRMRDRNSDERRVALPDLGDLRGEAVMALIASDASEAREIPLNMVSMTPVSLDGNRMVQVSYAQDGTFAATFRFIDLKTNQEIDRKSIKFDAKEPSPFTALTQITALDREGKRALCRNPVTINELTINELPSGKKLVSLTDSRSKAAPKQNDRARFSPDGMKISAVRRSILEKKDETIDLVVWNLERPDTPHVLEQRPAKKSDGFMLAFLDIDVGEFSSTRFSPDSKRICYVSSDRKTIHVRDLTVNPPAKLPDISVPGNLVTLDWHPTKPELAMLVANKGTAQRPSLVLWDLAEGKARLSREWDFPLDSDQGFASLAFSPDGRTLAAGGGQYTTVHVYGADDLVERFRLLDTALIGVARIFWTQEGELVVSSLMESLRFYKPSTERLSENLSTIRPHGEPIFSSDGRWLAFFAPTVSKSSSLLSELFDAKADKAILHERVALLDRKTGQISRFLPGQKEAEVHLLFAPDDKRIFVCSKNEIVGFDTTEGTEVFRRAPLMGVGLKSWDRVFFLPDGRLAALGHPDPGKELKPRPLTLWDIGNQKVVHAFQGKDPGFGVESKVSPKGDRLFSAHRMTFFKADKKEESSDRLYELPSGRLLAEIPRPDRGDNQMEEATAFSADGTRLLAMKMSMIGEDASFTKAQWTVRSLPQGEELLKIPNRNIAEHGNGFSADGRFVAMASDRGHVEVWDLTTRTLLFRWQPHGGKSVEFLSFSPEGDIATSAVGDERLMMLQMSKIRERLTAIGLGW